MIIPFPNWQVPLHTCQMYEPGSRHHRLRHLLTPTTPFSTASSDQFTSRRRPVARTFYAHRAAYMTKYSGHYLLVNASVTVHVHARLPSPDTLIHFKKRPNTFSVLFLPCSLSSMVLARRHITITAPFPVGRASSPTKHQSRFPSARHRLPLPKNQ
ncbi:hypothetical protein FOPG_18305 [Fusarium oxysporum f. sp. conglutinans race 2 54008]|uniref:Uncharacterized protein n=1 Tax=Fusarium oxysporum f. sp. conglutinans race 2 54008 TaxID=1089457 RepID=X0GQ79_FUSOX|nr:hypothetical protein FOPG_18305 [Fusarium oxysporum f. sp. conglutinans race 2 54008]